VHDIRRVSGIAILFVVVLRMAIGWQFVYEGYWKIHSQSTSKPWTAAGYLKNAQGPFRDYFRNMTGDPDDLNWLDPEKMNAKWDAWQTRFVTHFGLDKQQQSRLDSMMNGPQLFAADLDQLPEGVQFGGSLAKTVNYNADRKRLEVDGKLHLLARERDALLSLVSAGDQSPEAKAYREAVRKVYQRATRLSYKEQMRASLAGDPERAGTELEYDKKPVEKRKGRIEWYQELLARYENDLKEVSQDFEQKHLDKQWRDIQEVRAELVGPVKALEKEMKEKAEALLTPEQIARGPVPEPMTQLRQADLITMWGLLILGLMLVAGLFSPLAAIGGAGLLTMFYLAFPPFPGVPPAPGPEHSLFINKNMIEIIALLAIACLPTGRWFGIDALLFRSRYLIPVRRAQQSQNKKNQDKKNQDKKNESQPAGKKPVTAKS